jgi:predicted anti-sigma-YlaC factor YlaD
MDCERCRTALSARLDGEDPGVLPAALDAHLAGCAACREFAAGAERLHRLARVAPAEPVPDLSDPIMAAIGPLEQTVPDPRPVDERTQFLRITLAVVAVIQLAMAVPALVLGDDAGLPAHVARHLGSFSVALGVGLLVVAWRPDRAAGLLPVVGVVVLCLLASAAVDIANGRAAPGAEVSHAPELVGLVAVWLLARAGSVTTRWARPVLG